MKQLHKRLIFALILAITLAIIHYLVHFYGGTVLIVTLVVFAISFFSLFGVMYLGGD